MGTDDDDRQPGIQVSQPTSGPGASAERDLGPRVLALAERIVEMERALGMREWWLLGRNLPEAQALSEMASLLAVARGELQQVLTEVFALPLSSAPEGAGSDAGESHLSDPAWIAARGAEARQLLDRAVVVLPALQQYAQVLRARAERLALPPAALDAFGIVYDRVSEACELLQHPPERASG